MILAAGRGTRLAPLTDTTPKPLLSVRGKPLIQWQIEHLRRAGFTELVINLHHLGKQIEAFVGNGSKFGVTIDYSREAALLETGGGIVHALPLLGDGPFAILNGDIYTDFDFTNLPTTLEGDALAHLVLTPTPAHRAQGDFLFDGRHVTGRGDDYVYCGIALLSPALFENAPTGPFSWTGDHLFNHLDEIEITGQVFNGAWTDIGTLEQYHAVR
jgi:MurNAc alpha-1-phosphate uridylyltransferase